MHASWQDSKFHTFFFTASEEETKLFALGGKWAAFSSTTAVPNCLSRGPLTFLSLAFFARKKPFPELFSPLSLHWLSSLISLFFDFFPKCGIPFWRSIELLKKKNTGTAKMQTKLNLKFVSPDLWFITAHQNLGRRETPADERNLLGRRTSSSPSWG